MFKPYNNEFWEPVFCAISPVLSKLYFATGIGPVRRFAAWVIFKKLDWLENCVD